MQFNYDKATFDDLDERTVRLIILDDNEAFAVLKAHLIIERILDVLIARNLKYSKRLTNNQRLSFEMKLSLVRGFGVIPETDISAIQSLNKIRNNIAHNEDYEPTITELKRLQFDWEPMQKKAFKVASAKSIKEATQISCLFLVWKCLHYIAAVKESDGV